MDNLEGRTCVCCKILGRGLARGERLIKFGYSWFSTKFILVKHFFIIRLVKYTFWLMGAAVLLTSKKLRRIFILVDGLVIIRLLVERETAQIAK